MDNVSQQLIESTRQKLKEMTFKRVVFRTLSQNEYYQNQSYNIQVIWPRGQENFRWPDNRTGLFEAGYRVDRTLSSIVSDEGLFSEFWAIRITKNDAGVYLRAVKNYLPSLVETA